VIHPEVALGHEFFEVLVTERKAKITAEKDDDFGFEMPSLNSAGRFLHIHPTVSDGLNSFATHPYLLRQIEIITDHPEYGINTNAKRPD